MTKYQILARSANVDEGLAPVTTEMFSSKERTASGKKVTSSKSKEAHPLDKPGPSGGSHLAMLRDALVKFDTTDQRQRIEEKKIDLEEAFLALKSRARPEVKAEISDERHLR
ncbi:hypothetical protein CTA1_4399 [Colletotrichum tanaceti]|uniref:Uncharacterized protein n=1 Tax=Colletotrichum tanaceti TaxID=1306861 RepID=A0A4U6X454_9PEZI|nr:hypothetical protein CTA1_4399 [Colletotrichum tanaceti]